MYLGAKEFIKIREINNGNSSATPPPASNTSDVSLLIPENLSFEKLGYKWTGPSIVSNACQVLNPSSCTGFKCNYYISIVDKRDTTGAKEGNKYKILEADDFFGGGGSWGLYGNVKTSNLVQEYIKLRLYKQCYCVRGVENIYDQMQLIGESEESNPFFVEETGKTNVPVFCK